MFHPKTNRIIKDPTTPFFTNIGSPTALAENTELIEEIQQDQRRIKVVEQLILLEKKLFPQFDEKKTQKTIALMERHTNLNVPEAYKAPLMYLLQLKQNNKTSSDHEIIQMLYQKVIENADARKQMKQLDNKTPFKTPPVSLEECKQFIDDIRGRLFSLDEFAKRNLYENLLSNIKSNINDFVEIADLKTIIDDIKLIELNMSSEISLKDFLKLIENAIYEKFKQYEPSIAQEHFPKARIQDYFSKIIRKLDEVKNLVQQPNYLVLEKMDEEPPLIEKAQTMEEEYTTVPRETAENNTERFNRFHGLSEKSNEEKFEIHDSVKKYKQDKPTRADAECFFNALFDDYKNSSSFRCSNPSAKRIQLTDDIQNRMEKELLDDNDKLNLALILHQILDEIVGDRKGSIDTPFFTPEQLQWLTENEKINTCLEQYEKALEEWNQITEEMTAGLLREKKCFEDENAGLDAYQTYFLNVSPGELLNSNDDAFTVQKEAINNGIKQGEPVAIAFSYLTIKHEEFILKQKNQLAEFNKYKERFFSVNSPVSKEALRTLLNDFFKKEKVFMPYFFYHFSSRLYKINIVLYLHGQITEFYPNPINTAYKQTIVIDLENQHYSRIQSITNSNTKLEQDILSDLEKRYQNLIIHSDPMIKETIIGLCITKYSKLGITDIKEIASQLSKRITNILTDFEPHAFLYYLSLQEIGKLLNHDGGKTDDILEFEKVKVLEPLLHLLSQFATDTTIYEDADRKIETAKYIINILKGDKNRLEVTMTLLEMIKNKNKLSSHYHFNVANNKIEFTFQNEIAGNTIPFVVENLLIELLGYIERPNTVLLNELAYQYSQILENSKKKQIQNLQLTIKVLNLKSLPEKEIFINAKTRLNFKEISWVYRTRLLSEFIYNAVLEILDFPGNNYNIFSNSNSNIESYFMRKYYLSTHSRFVKISPGSQEKTVAELKEQGLFFCSGLSDSTTDAQNKRMYFIAAFARLMRDLFLQKALGIANDETHLLIDRCKEIIRLSKKPDYGYRAYNAYNTFVDHINRMMTWAKDITLIALDTGAENNSDFCIKYSAGPCTYDIKHFPTKGLGGGVNSIIDKMPLQDMLLAFLQDDDNMFIPNELFSTEETQLSNVTVEEKNHLLAMIEKHLNGFEPLKKRLHKFVRDNTEKDIFLARKKTEFINMINEVEILSDSRTILINAIEALGMNRSNADKNDLLESIDEIEAIFASEKSKYKIKGRFFSTIKRYIERVDRIFLNGYQMLKQFMIDFKNFALNKGAYPTCSSSYSRMKKELGTLVLGLDNKQFLQTVEDTKVTLEFNSSSKSNKLKENIDASLKYHQQFIPLSLFKLSEYDRNKKYVVLKYGDLELIVVSRSGKASDLFNKQCDIDMFIKQDDEIVPLSLYFNSRRNKNLISDMFRALDLTQEIDTKQLDEVASHPQNESHYTLGTSSKMC